VLHERTSSPRVNPLFYLHRVSILYFTASPLLELT
jgi:hypothetical protein